MAAIFRLTEAFLLVSMGAFMAVLSQSSMYWQFINPKYSWLTLVSGVVLAITGFGSLINTQRQRKVSEFVGILVFLFLAGTALTSFDYMREGDLGGSLTMESVADALPSVVVGDTEYTKINGAELLLGEQGGFVSAGQAYAVQGAVVRTPELDQAGFIALGRLNIICCFADSVGVVTLVKVANPEGFEHGSWARALGVLEEGTVLQGKSIIISGSLTGTRSEKHFLRATEVKEQSVAGLPFIFEVRDQVPFAY